MKDRTLKSKWLTTSEAANFLRTTEKAVHNLVHSGKLRAFKFGRLNRYQQTDLDSLIVEMTPHPTSRIHCFQNGGQNGN